MKKRLHVTTFLFFVFSINLLQAQPWDLVRETENAERLKAIAFPDSLNGWMVGNKPGDNIGYIIHTSDGGESWVEQESAISTYLVDAYFFNSSVGFILGAAGLQKTVDGGAQWSEVDLGVDVQFPIYTSIDFVDSTGYIVSDGGILLKSEDGGDSWTDISSLEARLYNSMEFLNKDTGIIAGGYNTLHYALRTIDGGITWDSLEIETPAISNEGAFIDICTVQDSVVYVTGRLGKVVKSTDYGETWTEMTPISIKSNDLLENTAIYFQDADTGWVSTTLLSKQAALIHRTNDGGLTWDEELFFIQSPSVGIYDLKFAENGIGWACGDQSGLTLNGELIFKGSGEIVEPPTSALIELAPEFTVIQNLPNPFTNRTKILFELDQHAEIELIIYTASGQLIEVLYSGELPSGAHSFNFNGESHETGIYLTVLKKNGVTSSKKMVLSR